jgi:hypothetical protein
VRHCSTTGACSTSCDEAELKETKTTTNSQNCFVIAISRMAIARFRLGSKGNRVSINVTWMAFSGGGARMTQRER